MSKVGYARVSTSDQSLDLQIDALKRDGCSKVFAEKMSGVNAKRPEYRACMEYLREGDVLVVWKLDRLGRSTKQLIDAMANLEDRGVQFRSITDDIDTTTPAGRFYFHVLAALAEMEHDLIVERTNAGLEAARKRGHKGGRPRVDSDKIAEAIELYRTTERPIREICSTCGVSPSTLYKYMGKDSAARRAGER